MTSPDAYPELIECFAGPPPTSEQEPPDRNVRSKDDDRFRLAQRVRLGVDQLQIVLADSWRRTVHGAAVWIAGVYGVGLAHAIDRPASAEPRYVLAAVLIGGPITWLAHDLAALVGHARQ